MQTPPRAPNHASPDTGGEVPIDINKLRLRWAWPLAHVAERFGNTVALRLAEEFGGSYVYMPVRAASEHAIAKVAGQEVLDFLLTLRGVEPCSKLTMPNAVWARRGILQARAAQMQARGLGSSEIARRLGLHIRATQTLLAAARKEARAKGARVNEIAA